MYREGPEFLERWRKRDKYRKTGRWRKRDNRERSQ